MEVVSVGTHRTLSIRRVFHSSVYAVSLTLTGVALPSELFADDVSRRIPNEYESTGGHGLAFNNAGTAAMGGVSAVRTNPAMLSLEREYSVAAGYHWPTSGRDFYQAGVVDSKTAAVAAGVMYSSFSDDFEKAALASKPGEVDSPVKRRLAIGVGQSFKMLSLGIGGQWVQGYEAKGVSDRDEKNEVSGTALSLGVASMVNPQLRVGLSAENMTNRKIAEFAPKTYRAGLAYLLAGGDISLSLDFRQRDRITRFEGSFPDAGLGGFALSKRDSGLDEAYEKPEQMVIGSGTAKIQNFLRLIASWGQSVGSEDRKSVAGGVAVVNDKLSLSYLASRPYFPSEESHQAINLNIEMSM